MIFIFNEQISANFLSQLIITPIFQVSVNSLSPKVKIFGATFSCLYSTHSSGSNLEDVNLNHPVPIIFPSLEKGYEQIKFQFIGVSDVYKLTNKNDPRRFYIGSSNNLARRMDEYINLTKGLRKPQSSAELEISNTWAIEWSLEFLYLTIPQLSLVYEQYAIIKFKPTINKYIQVVPRVNPL